MLDGGAAISVAAHVLARTSPPWWLDALAACGRAAAAGLEQTGPVGGIYDDELFTQDAGHARVYLPVRDSPAIDGTGVRWQLPAARFAVALHVGPHRDVDRSYAALGTYAAAHGRDGAGPVRERYLTDPFDTADAALWRTEVCWPLAPPAPRRTRAGGFRQGTPRFFAVVWNLRAGFFVLGLRTGGDPDGADGRSTAELERFLAERADHLLRTAVLLAGNREKQGEDLLQTAVERLLRQWGRIDGDPEGYVRRTLCNLAIDGYRRAGRWRQKERLLRTELRQPQDATGDVDLPPRSGCCCSCRPGSAPCSCCATGSS